MEPWLLKLIEMLFILKLFILIMLWGQTGERFQSFSPDSRDLKKEIAHWSEKIKNVETVLWKLVGLTVPLFWLVLLVSGVTFLLKLKAILVLLIENKDIVSLLIVIPIFIIVLKYVSQKVKKP